MGRAILAVVAGYLAMAILVMVTLSLAWMAMGTELAYQQGTTRVTGLWLTVNLVLSFVAAVVGGRVAALVARRWKPVKALVAVVLVLGLGMAVAHRLADKPAGRTAAAEGRGAEEMSSFEAASEAVQPTWYEFVLPLVGAAGVLLGGRLGLGDGPG